MAGEGPNSIAGVREINGATRPSEAKPGSIRGDLALDTGHNLVHGSDAPETAERELSLWFSDAELIAYDRDMDRWVLD